MRPSVFRATGRRPCGPMRLSRLSGWSRAAHGQSLHIEADRLSYYHAGAVMASNALMAVLDAAVILLAHAGVERDAALRAIGPLARTSLRERARQRTTSRADRPNRPRRRRDGRGAQGSAARRRTDGREAVRGGGDAPAAAREAARASPRPACARSNWCSTKGPAEAGHYVRQVRQSRCVTWRPPSGGPFRPTVAEKG